MIMCVTNIKHLSPPHPQPQAARSPIMSHRQLKFHEKKLLRKVDFLFTNSQTQRENEILSRYMIQRREDYTKYNRIVGQTHKLVNKLTKLPPDSEYRVRMTEQLVRKLYVMGIITGDSSLSACAKITASSFCRRRLPVVMVRLKMAENLRMAITLIEQAHVRVGTDCVTDPAFLVTRTLEDFVTWVDTSRVKRTVEKYNDRIDDFTLLGN
jgi:U3 small nucleolar ribonucleoprotein protein IMP3